MSELDDWMPRAGTVIDGRYRLLSMVDQGGMGVVMKAEQLNVDRIVAIKLLNPESSDEPGYRARFRREAKVVSSLDHANIVRCFDFGETPEGSLYLVMELLEGQSLAELLRGGRLELRRAAGIAIQMLNGLAAAHMRSIVHRDLKPGNVFVSTDFRGADVVKLLDFGLAKSLESEDVKLTKTGAIAGTPAYIAPEVLITDESSIGGDVYACGLIMLEMVLGRKVFEVSNLAQSFAQHLTLAPQIPQRIWNTGYGQLAAQALRKHPAERPSNADVMYRTLEGMLPALPEVMLAPLEIPPVQTLGPPGSVLQELASGTTGLERLHELPRAVPWGTGSQLAPIEEPLQLAELKPITLREPPSAVAVARANVRQRPERRAGVSNGQVLALVCLISLIAVAVYWGIQQTKVEPPAAETVGKPTIPAELLKSEPAEGVDVLGVEARAQPDTEDVELESEKKKARQTSEIHLDKKDKFYSIQDLIDRF